MSICGELQAVIIPPALKPGDKIAIVAPAGPVKRARVDTAAAVLERSGYVPVVYPSSYSSFGHFSAPASKRLKDMREALCDTSIKAILCARGGYGAVHLLDSLASLPIDRNPKWVIGLSDITALHGLMASKGVASLHAGMTSQLTRGADDPDNRLFFDILKGEWPEYEFEGNIRNHPGVAEGRLLGGNLSVAQALIGTPYNLIKPGTILFIEDVAEPLYKLERMLWQLRLSGILGKLNGLILGQFTEYKADQNYKTAEEMMAEVLADYPDLPVAFDIPIGHVKHNLPVIEGVPVRLEVTRDSVRLSYRNPNQP